MSRTRDWTAEERAAADLVLAELVASGVFGASETEVQRAFSARWKEIRKLADEPARVAVFAFMAEIDRVVPGASSKLFPVSLEAIRSSAVGTA